jgi:hypothetical protein
VIVNAAESVDKSNFLHKLKGLPPLEAAGQGLFSRRTKTGQEIGDVQVDRFRTFDPVDIHWLVHRAGGSAASSMVFCPVRWQEVLGGRLMLPGSPTRFSDQSWIGNRLQARSRFYSRIGDLTEAEFFFGQIGRFKKARQVYKQSLYIE